MVELVVFGLAGAICLGGALGVVLNRNPVHAALSLVATLFGIAVLFIAQDANFLAAVQIIVYAGAIVVLFLFVLMLLGVDRAEDLSIEPLGGQRLAAVVIGLGVLALPLLAIASTGGEATGARPTAAVAANGAPGTPAAANHIDHGVADVAQLGRSLFTDYLFAFEVTSVLLVIAVVGAVVLSRKVKRADLIDDPLVTAVSPPETADQGADS
ncbi:MAG: NADH-quinone oxidoreductase subunit J [Acidimicrobiales bacterium]